MAHAQPMRPLVAVADDDEIHSEVVAVWLDHHGFDVLRFGSGDELLAWAQDGTPHRVDAVLLDVEMPGRDGFQVHAELRLLPEFCATPTVLVSGAPPEVLAERARGSGVDASMAKDADFLPRLSAWLTEYLAPPVA